MHPSSIESMVDRLIELTYEGTAEWVDNSGSERSILAPTRDFQYTLKESRIVFTGAISRVTTSNHYFFLGDDGRTQHRAAFLSEEKGLALFNAINAKPMAKLLEKELDKYSTTLEDL